MVQFNPKWLEPGASVPINSSVIGALLREILFLRAEVRTKGVLLERWRDKRNLLRVELGVTRKAAEKATRKAYCSGWKDYQHGKSLSKVDEDQAWEDAVRTFPELVGPQNQQK